MDRKPDNLHPLPPLDELHVVPMSIIPGAVECPHCGGRLRVRVEKSGDGQATVTPIRGADE